MSRRDGWPVEQLSPTDDRIMSESGHRPWTILAVMCCGMFLVQLDVTAVNVALPAIGDDLRSGTSGLQLVVDGYTAALAIAMLPGGALADRFGPRRTVLCGLVGFAVSSAVAACAPSIGVLVAARVAQGLSAAVLLPGTLAVIGTLFTSPAAKARAIGVWAGASALALPTGPLLGGALTSGLSWRWVFAVNVPVCAAAAIFSTRLLHRAPTTSPPPIDTRRLFGDRVFVASTVVSVAMNLVGIGMIFVVSLDLQTARGFAPFDAGVRLLPLVIPLAALSPVTGRLAARVGTRPPVVAGLVVGAAGSAVVAATASAPYPLFACGLALLGIGMGLVTPAAVAMAMASAPPELAGTASGINNAARQAAGAVGVALFGAIAADPPSGLALCGVLSAALWLAAATHVVVLRRRETPTPVEPEASPRADAHRAFDVGISSDDAPPAGRRRGCRDPRNGP